MVTKRIKSMMIDGKKGLPIGIPFTRVIAASGGREQMRERW